MKKKAWQEQVVKYMDRVDAATLKRDLKYHKIKLRPPSSRTQLCGRETGATSQR